MRVLLTGFGPFPGAPSNPSARLVEVLARRRRPALAGIKLTTHVLATVYAAVDRDLPKLFAAKPDIVLMFGLAGRRRALSVERRARNAVSVLFPDASRHRPSNGVIAHRAPAARKGNAPFAQLVDAARRSALPSQLSRDAGRYLCNYAYWRALERAHHGRPLVAFVHIPPVRINPRPKRKARSHAPTLAALVGAAEALLIALVAAAKT
jgi:pyroglutamyl-peptidase